jgi:hypothetical protein
MQRAKTDGIVPDQKDAADEACDDIGIVNAESLPFMVEISFDTSVSFDDIWGSNHNDGQGIPRGRQRIVRCANRTRHV